MRKRFSYMLLCAALPPVQARVTGCSLLYHNDAGTNGRQCILDGEHGPHNPVNGKIIRFLLRLAAHERLPFDSASG